MWKGRVTIINYLPDLPRKLEEGDIGRVYELSKEDILLIEELNEKNKIEDKIPLLMGWWYYREKEGRTKTAICCQNIHSEIYKEYYEALNKIKPFSEREVVEIKNRGF